mmetsp:Transcript_25803/g.65029  ORF Transcript_25803/g.65029 Transcript_25803/m.65029 type:complete len:641 (+) Transcript_25803:21-1943(+)
MAFANVPGAVNLQWKVVDGASLSLRIPNVSKVFGSGGKTLRVCSSLGNKKIPGSTRILSVNAYRKKDKEFDAVGLKAFKQGPKAKNVQLKVKGLQCLAQIDLACEPLKSLTGKRSVVATTGGFSQPLGSSGVYLQVNVMDAPEKARLPKGRPRKRPASAAQTGAGKRRKVLRPKKLEPAEVEEAPLLGAQHRSKWFVRFVEKYDPKRDRSVEDAITEVLGEIAEQYDPKKHGPDDAVTKALRKKVLPTGKVARAKALIRLYTMDTQLYLKVNEGLRKDSRALIQAFAPYISALRDCFRSDGLIKGLQPFYGEVKRRITLPSNDAAERYVRSEVERDGDVCWPAFTSTSMGEPLEGNMLFEISCNKMLEIAVREGRLGRHYVPAAIKHLSAFGIENEVLFPPHVLFRVHNKNIKMRRVQLETKEFPLVWDLIKARDWRLFKLWAEKHSGRVNTTDCSYSLINEVAREYLDAEEEAGDVNPLEICVQHGANINEEEPKSGDTPTIKVARAVARTATPKARAAKLLDWCIVAGGNAQAKPSRGGHSAQELAPEAVKRSQAKAKRAFRWDYYVEDGIDGKAEGWYPYDAEAWPSMEAGFTAWCRGGPSTLVVPSGAFRYEVDYRASAQKNTTTGKRRLIVRVPL